MFNKTCDSTSCRSPLWDRTSQKLLALPAPLVTPLVVTDPAPRLPMDAHHPQQQVFLDIVGRRMAAPSSWVARQPLGQLQLRGQLCSLSSPNATGFHRLPQLSLDQRSTGTEQLLQNWGRQCCPLGSVPPVRQEPFGVRGCWSTSERGSQACHMGWGEVPWVPHHRHPVLGGCCALTDKLLAQPLAFPPAS